MLYFLIVFLHIYRFSDRLIAYSLSNIPILGDLHTAIILVVDKLSMVMLVLIGIYYLYITIGNMYKHVFTVDQFILLSILVLNATTLDLILSFTLFLALTLYLVTIKNNFFITKYAIIYVLLFTFGYLFSNTFNIGLLIFLYRFLHLPENLLGLGTYLYTLGYLSILFLSINSQPLFNRNTKLDQDERLGLLLFSLPIILRLQPVLSILYNTTFYYVYCYFLLVIGSLGVLHYSLKYLGEARSEYLVFYESAYMLLALSIGSPMGLYAVLIVLIVYFIHYILGKASIFSSKNSLKDLVVLSRVGLFPFPGFLARVYVFSVLYAFFGVAGLIIPLISYLFLIFASVSEYAYTLLLGGKSVFLLTILSLIIMFSSTFLESTSNSLYMLGDYQRIVFGV